MSEELTLYHFPASFYAQKSHIYLLEKGVQFKEEIIDLMKHENLNRFFLLKNSSGTVPVLEHGEKTITDSHEIFLFGEENLSGPKLLPANHKDEILKLSKDINTVNGNALFFGGLLSEKYSANFKLPAPQRQAMKGAVSEDNIQTAYKEAIDHVRLNNFCMTPSPEFPIEKVKEFFAQKAETDKKLIAALEQSRDNKLKNTPALSDPGFFEKLLQGLSEVLSRMEQQLDKTHKANPNSSTFLLSTEPTIADIDLVVLMARLYIMGLEDTFFSEAKAPNLHRFFKQWQSRPSFKKAVLHQ